MTADTIGGVWTFALDLSRALGGVGIEVVLATMGRRVSADQHEQARLCPGLTVVEGDYRLEWMQEPWEDVRRAGEWLLGLAGEVRPDLIHLNGYVHAALTWNAPVIVMAHSCVLSWWEAVKRQQAPPEYERYRSDVAAGLRAADLVVAPTRAMLACIDRHYGPLPRTRVIPNGRDAVEYFAAEKEPFVLAAGRVWDEAKNIAALAAVAPSLSWPVVVAGDDLHPNGSRRPPANVMALGRLSAHDLAGWYSRASIYALPARYEPFGLSVLEAALSGCALVLGDIPSLRENWDGTALFAPPDDSEALSRAIQGLIDHPGLRTAMAARAKEQAALFTSTSMSQRWLQAYDQTIASKELVQCA